MHRSNLARLFDGLYLFAPDGDGGSGNEGGGKPPEGGNDGGKPPEGDAGNDMSALPDWAQKQIRELRSEAAGHRTKVKELEPLAQKAKELEDASKSDSQKLSEERDALKSKVAPLELENARLRVALDKGLSASQARRLVGNTEEELAADADELLKDLGKGDGDGGGRTPPSRKPTEKLRPAGGGGDDEPEETDPRKLADSIPRR